MRAAPWTVWGTWISLALVSSAIPIARNPSPASSAVEMLVAVDELVPHDADRGLDREHDQQRDGEGNAADQDLQRLGAVHGGKREVHDVDRVGQHPDEGDALAEGGACERYLGGAGAHSHHAEASHDRGAERAADGDRQHPLPQGQPDEPFGAHRADEERHGEQLQGEPEWDRAHAVARSGSSPARGAGRATRLPGQWLTSVRPPHDARRSWQSASPLSTNARPATFASLDEREMRASLRNRGETRLVSPPMIALIVGADNLEFLVDEDVVRPVDADLWTSYSPLLSFTTRSTMPPG